MKRFHMYADTMCKVAASTNKNCCTSEIWGPRQNVTENVILREEGEKLYITLYHLDKNTNILLLAP
jgi:hypothetical protein